MNLTINQSSSKYLLQALCALALALGMGLSGALATESRNVFPAPVYVTLQGSNAVQMLPAGGAWSGLDGAHFMDVSADGTRLLVSSKKPSEVYLLDATSGEKLATFDIGPVAQGVQISPNGRWGLAISAGNGTVSVIDMRERKVVKTIHVGKAPHNAIFTADGTLAYVTLQGGGAVAMIDMQALEMTGKFPVPGMKAPHNLDLSANGETLWIRGFLGKVAAVDVKTHEVVALFKVGASHAGIDVVPGSHYVVTGGMAGHVVTVINTETLEVVKRIDVGQAPHGVRASRNGRWVYAAVVGTDKVAVIDMKTLEVVKQVPVDGKLPFWIAVVGNN